jgi:formate hydrogenlyase subunit 6/NADH:ubiquinone oxidoreductase subunit I
MYFAGLPKIVYDFIEKAQIKNSRYIFAVITCGFPYIASAISEIRVLLKKKSLRLDAGFYVRMADNFVIAFKMKSESESLKNAINKNIENITGSIKGSRTRRTFELPILSSLSGTTFRRKVNNVDVNFHCLPSCDSCQICMKICPVNNIVMEGGKPKWNHGCQACFACIHACPKESIQYGKATLKKGRYRNPNISLKEIMGQKG